MSEKPIVEWLREVLRDISQFDARGIAVASINKDGDSYVSYYKMNMADKVLISGLIQQDAMLDTLAQNVIIGYDESDEGDDAEEEEDNG